MEAYTNVQTWSIGPHPFKALKEHQLQAYEHTSRTENGMASGSKPLKQSKDGMLEGSMLTAYKKDYMVAIQSEAWTTRMTKNRP